MTAVEAQPTELHTAHWDDPAEVFSAAAHALQDAMASRSKAHFPHSDGDVAPQPPPPRDALYVLLPLLIVLSTFLFLLLLFLICVIILRRRRGIMLRDHDGPVDMSREDLVEGEGGFDGVESRWLESVGEAERRNYIRAKRTCIFGRVKALANP